MSLYIWHNPRCAKSRQALELLRSRGAEPEVVEYLKNTPSRTQIREVIDLLGIGPHSLLRKGEAAYRERGLKDVTDPDELVEAMFHDPILIERPIIIENAGTQDARAAIARPPEIALDFV